MATEYRTIRQNGPPTKTTPGAVGQKYIDTANGMMYECTEAFVHRGYNFSREVYNWEKRGPDLDFLATDQEVDDALDILKTEISGMDGLVFAELIN